MIPKIENSIKEYLRSNKSEINPIAGGPIKKPKKAIVDTSVRDILALTLLRFPVTPYTVGTLHEPPSPTIINPRVHTIKFTENTDRSRPDVIKIPDICITFFLPNLTMR
jgi:hypothetical protein